MALMAADPLSDEHKTGHDARANDPA